MPKAIAGVLVECDPSIKAIILKIDKEHNHDIIIEDIDDEHLLIKTAQQENLKGWLKDALKDTVKEAEESSEED
ncbi:unnamed protein product [Zymoseptoria tritici ST99CH_1A5]|uniref:General transcription and DNA repair factor IIH subunit TFB5 n=3 Tax=Zymoseptoria tritici TaxID=1047171 RepID=A0A1X7RCU3_ZYMT9|nr:unnamed protein product [Zymoseptoria tritici ST99CH_3D7]SMR41407.1 unnamed protein product [Zymoseptoria tritici ST99CH_1E4]SMR43607.1 unnamed protein product [Zymoseptoria tritici ST99CH_3D1]SMY18751.1 unnamed protein product [Zymoseptoria tritici ST99CH_1A5]